MPGTVLSGSLGLKGEQINKRQPQHKVVNAVVEVNMQGYWNPKGKSSL